MTGKALPLMLGVAGVLLAPAAVAPALPNLCFTDDFNDGVLGPPWMEIPGGNVYSEADGALRVRGAFVGNNAILQLIRNVGDYNAAYDAGKGPNDNEVNPRIAGFAVRVVDENNYIAFQGFTTIRPELLKFEGGAWAGDDLEILHRAPGGWQPGNYNVTARGNVYTVDRDGVLLLSFRDNGNDFMGQRIGFEFLAGAVLHNHDLWWDSFQLRTLLPCV